MWLPTKDKVRRELVDLLARSCRTEAAIKNLVDRMRPFDGLLGQLPTLADFQSESSEGSRVIAVALVALDQGQLSCREIASRLGAIERRVARQEGAIVAMTKSYDVAHFPI